MDISPDKIKQVLEAFDASDWDELDLVAGEVRVRISTRPDADAASGLGGVRPVAHAPSPVAAAAGPPAAAPAEAAESSPAPVTTGPTVEVVSPTLGLFWRAASPGSPPFVDVGTTIAAGDTVCIVEVMKLMNYVKAEEAGRVVAVLVANGEQVSQGQTLFVIEVAVP